MYILSEFEDKSYTYETIPTIKAINIFLTSPVFLPLSLLRDFPGGSDGKESACNMGDLSLIPGSERSPGEGNGNLLQYSCLENSMDRGAWRLDVTNHGVTKSWT